MSEHSPGMNKEQAEALATVVRQEAPHLTIAVVPSHIVFEFMEGKDDGTWVCQLAVPGEPSPSTVTARMARVLETEEDWQRIKGVGRWIEKHFA